MVLGKEFRQGEVGFLAYRLIVSALRAFIRLTTTEIRTALLKRNIQLVMSKRTLCTDPCVAEQLEPVPCVVSFAFLLHNSQCLSKVRPLISLLGIFLQRPRPCFNQLQHIVLRRHQQWAVRRSMQPSSANAPPRFNKTVDKTPSSSQLAKSRLLGKVFQNLVQDKRRARRWSMSRIVGVRRVSLGKRIRGNRSAKDPPQARDRLPPKALRSPDEYAKKGDSQGTRRELPSLLNVAKSG